MGWSSESAHLWGSLLGFYCRTASSQLGDVRLLFFSPPCLSFFLCKMGIRTRCDTACEKPLLSVCHISSPSEGLCSLMSSQVPNQDTRCLLNE